MGIFDWIDYFGWDDDGKVRVACRIGDERMLRRLIKKGIDPNAHTSVYERAIDIAIYYGNLKIVTILIEHGLDIRYIKRAIEYAQLLKKREVEMYLQSLVAIRANTTAIQADLAASPPSANSDISQRTSPGVETSTVNPQVGESGIQLPIVANRSANQIETADEVWQRWISPYNIVATKAAPTTDQQQKPITPVYLDVGVSVGDTVWLRNNRLSTTEIYCIGPMYHPDPARYDRTKYNLSADSALALDLVGRQEGEYTRDNVYTITRIVAEGSVAKSDATPACVAPSNIDRSDEPRYDVNLYPISNFETVDETNDRADQLDGSKNLGFVARDQGQYGSYPGFDDMGDESRP